jgi:hypothetical protein
MLSPPSVIVSVQLQPYLLDANCRLTTSSSLSGLVVAVVEDASAGVEEKGDGAVVLVLMSPTPLPLSSAVCLVGTFVAVAYVGMIRKSAGTFETLCEGKKVHIQAALGLGLLEFLAVCHESSFHFTSRTRTT